MLLLDSWSPLVTATCPITGQAPLIPKLRGYFAEFPKLQLNRHALAFSARGTCVRSRYGCVVPFSRVPEVGSRIHHDFTPFSP